MHCEPVCRYSAQSSISAFFVTCPAHSYIYFAIYNLLVCSWDVFHPQYKMLQYILSEHIKSAIVCTEGLSATLVGLLTTVSPRENSTRCCKNVGRFWEICTRFSTVLCHWPESGSAVRG
jgi:hypothetical protein